MAIALVSPAVGYIGNGHVVESTSTLAVAGGNVLVEILDPLLAILLTSGDGLTGGPGVTNGVILGVGQRHVVQPRVGLPLGNAITMRITYYSNFFVTVVDTANFAAAFLHDPVSGLGTVTRQLEQLAQDTVSAVNGARYDILNVLVRTFPPP